MRRSLCVVLFLLGFAPFAASAQEARQWLQKTGLSDDGLAKLDAGQVQVWLPKPKDQTQLAVLAVVRLSVTVDSLRRVARDVAGLVSRNEYIKQAGEFSPQPSWRDAAGLSLPDDDVSDLEDCKVGSCMVKLTAGGIDSLGQAVDWSADNAADRVNRFMAGWIAGYVAGYQAGGSDALAVYADKAKPLSVASGLDELLDQIDLLIEYDKDFFDYARDYPARESAQAENLFYWTMEDTSLKRTLSVNHMAIRGPQADPLLIVIKHIYASHFFQAGVTVYAALPVVDDDPSAGVYMLMTQRLLFDGKVGGIQRRMLDSGSQKGAKSQLEGVRRKIEGTD